MPQASLSSLLGSNFLFVHLTSLDVFDAFFDNCKLPLLLRLQKLDMGWREEISRYIKKKWNPSLIVSPYFHNVPLFWSTLGSTDGVLSGPATRNLFRESWHARVGLDIFITAPYTRILESFLVTQRYRLIRREAGLSGAHPEGFGVQTLCKLTFERDQAAEDVVISGGISASDQVRVVVARYSVVACVLAFPCSCDMNFITSRYAICPYACGTLLRHAALVFRTNYDGPDDYERERVRECRAAGWKVYRRWETQLEQTFANRTARWIGDSFCWAINWAQDGEQVIGLSPVESLSRNGWAFGLVGQGVVEHRFDYVVEYGTLPPLVETRASVEPPWRAFSTPVVDHTQYNFYMRQLLSDM